MSGTGDQNGRATRPAPDRSGSGRVFVGNGPRPGLLALLFPGQGSQYVGMLRELACLFPRMQAALVGMNGPSGRRQPTGSPPTGSIRPSAFDERTRQEQEDALRDTRFAQPAIGAVSLGLLGILEDFGVRPDMVGGHSFGELTALRAAGRIDDDALARLAHRRGALMADCAAEGSGAMLAAFAPIEQVERRHPRPCPGRGDRQQERPPAVRAVRPGRRDRAQPQRCWPNGGSRPASCPSRPPSTAGSSPAPASRSAGRSTRWIWPRPAIPVFANATAEPYPDDPRPARDLLAGQLARPVEFVAQVEAMYRMGARTFLEVGPDARLTGLVRSILEGRDHTAIAVDASRGSAGNVLDLACSLATLAALGYAVDLTRWDDG